MELSAELLFLYIAAWGFFYLLLVKLIADRSVQAWCDRFDQDKNPEGAELLVHLTAPIIDEIIAEQEDALVAFKENLFASIGPQVRETKKLSGSLTPQVLPWMN